ncbi:nitroreductase family protein [Methanobrevibacter sp. OttesenSCG-928-K11]|nr:nitroreductase family protein [Methanobrevibacter sp. OttesenSCG-928-K11]MDL2270486.1 nitroreductase family protein [Methanobrevibacter sp. OttesenSCG-928-I08]
MNSIFKRKSIREFQEKDVEDEKIERILKAGMQSPSAHNSQPWEFLVIKNKNSLKEISSMSPYAKLASKANTLIVVLGNLNKINDKKTEMWFMQDLSACTENILLQIVEEDLGGVWLGFYPEEERTNKFIDYFKLPEHIIPFSVIALGYPLNDYKAEDRFDKKRIHYENY